MNHRLALALVTAALAVLAFPAAAGAHNVRVSPRFGDFGSDFVFHGKYWQAFKSVRFFYDQHNDGTYEQTGRFLTNGKGRFRFRWEGETEVDTHRMCFRQRDTRFRKTYLKCKRFTLLPAD